jgi:hypothetical protein
VLARSNTGGVVATAAAAAMRAHVATRWLEWCRYRWWWWWRCPSVHEAPAGLVLHRCCAPRTSTGFCVGCVPAPRKGCTSEVPGCITCPPRFAPVAYVGEFPGIDQIQAMMNGGDGVDDETQDVVLYYLPTGTSRAMGARITTAAPASRRDQVTPRLGVWYRQVWSLQFAPTSMDFVLARVASAVGAFRVGTAPLQGPRNLPSRRLVLGRLVLACTVLALAAPVCSAAAVCCSCCQVLHHPVCCSCRRVQARPKVLPLTAATECAISCDAHVAQTRSLGKSPRGTNAALQFCPESLPALCRC